MEQWALLILLNPSNICVWTELLLYLSFLPLLLLLLSLLCTLDQCWAGIWFLFFNYWLFQVLEKKSESKNCQFGLFWKHSEFIHWSPIVSGVQREVVKLLMVRPWSFEWIIFLKKFKNWERYDHSKFEGSKIPKSNL